MVIDKLMKMISGDIKSDSLWMDFYFLSILDMTLHLRLYTISYFSTRWRCELLLIHCYLDYTSKIYATYMGFAISVIIWRWYFLSPFCSNMGGTNNIHYYVSLVIPDNGKLRLHYQFLYSVFSFWNICCFWF